MERGFWRYMEVIAVPFNVGINTSAWLLDLLRLGVLACYSYSAPNLTPDLSRKLLFQLSRCDNPRIREVLMLTQTLTRSLSLSPDRSAFVPSPAAEGAPRQDCDVTLQRHSDAARPRQQLHLVVPWAGLHDASGGHQTDGGKCRNDTGPDVCCGQKEARKDEGERAELLGCSSHVPLTHFLCYPQCEQVAYKELMALRSIVGALPNCVLWRINGQELLNDLDAPRMFKQMRKHQLKAVLHRVSEDAGNKGVERTMHKWLSWILHPGSSWVVQPLVLWVHQQSMWLWTVTWTMQKVFSFTSCVKYLSLFSGSAAKKCSSVGHAKQTYCY